MTTRLVRVVTTFPLRVAFAACFAYEGAWYGYFDDIVMSSRAQCAALTPYNFCYAGEEKYIIYNLLRRYEQVWLS